VRGLPKKWACPSRKWAGPLEKVAWPTEKWACSEGLWPKGGAGLRAAAPPAPTPGGDYAKDTPTFDKKGLSFALG